MSRASAAGPGHPRRRGRRRRASALPRRAAAGRQRRAYRPRRGRRGRWRARPGLPDDVVGTLARPGDAAVAWIRGLPSRAFPGRPANWPA
jgi:hypothetical protein